ncbi:anaerobic sulfatase maturase [Photobacterium japonica]|uniref:anaerobic sulfatase maturase n=1 Tax=Photobacterium japonica TaxID=2910235 RepID=UPI003D0F4F89
MNTSHLFSPAIATHPLYQQWADAAAQLPVSPHCYTMAKPSGSVCNLDCTYCFYLEKEKLYPERQKNWRMSDETLTQYVQQQIDAQQGPDVVFAWQGGEPTLLGIAFYRHAFALQNAYVETVYQATGQRKQITNTFQTNGVLIDDEWAQLFAEHQVLVGISIDGPQALHDHYRVKRNGQPSFDLVMRGITVLRRHGVRFNTLTVVNDVNGEQPEAVYDFLVSIGSDFLQFIPLVERSAMDMHTEKGVNTALNLVLPDDPKASVTPWSVGPAQFGDFLNRVFDVWVTRDVGKVFVQLFDSALASQLGYPATLCSHAARCGSNFALEANGDVYVCDHYVYPEHFLGNIHHTTLDAIKHSVPNRAFGLAKQQTLSAQCRQCAWLHACQGGCPKHRFVFGSNNESPLHYLCPSYHDFFTHSAPKIREMAGLLLRGKPASLVMNSALITN